MRVTGAALAIAVALMIGVGGSAAQAAGKCVMAGGSANMITPDLAKFMAKAALANSIKGMGAKAVGPITLKCDFGLPFYCLARQRACK